MLTHQLYINIMNESIGIYDDSLALATLNGRLFGNIEQV